MKKIYLNLKSKLSNVSLFFKNKKEAFIEKYLLKYIIMSNKNSFVLGLKKGLSIPTLPPKINDFYINPLMRIFRVIGGICILLVLSKNYLIFNNKIIQFTILSIACIHIIIIVIMSIIRVVYSIYTLITKSKEFEVRNSPLNLLASQLGRIIYCVKAGCMVTGGATSVLAAGITIDTYLVEAGRDKIFTPFIAEGVNKIFGAPAKEKLENLTEKKELLQKSDPKIASVESILTDYSKLNDAQRTEFWSKLAENINKEGKNNSNK